MGLHELPDPWYLRLSNARTPHDLYDLFYTEAGAIPRAAALLHTKFAQWMAAIQPHWQRYHEFVQQWVGDTLTAEDWRWFWNELGPDVNTVLARVLPGPDAPRWSLAGWLLDEEEFTGNPHGPFAEAYRQIAGQIIRERLGRGSKPQCCAACGRLFEPGRCTQRWCSTQCRNRVNQRDAYQRKRAAAVFPREDCRVPHLSVDSE